VHHVGSFVWSIHDARSEKHSDTQNSCVYYMILRISSYQLPAHH